MIETERLILRRWADSNRAAFGAMGRDPVVMEFLGRMQTQEETDAGVDRLNTCFDMYGYTFWAVERRSDAAFLGFAGPDRTSTILRSRLATGFAPILSIRLHGLIKPR